MYESRPLRLTAGSARTVITPPIGIHLSGYAGRLPSTGVHDDLLATALVLAERWATGDDRDSRIALVTLDLIGLYGTHIGPAIKACVAERTGIPVSRIFLCCSHTHYGPVVAAQGDMEGGTTAQAAVYREALPHHIAGVVAAADAARQPVRLAVGRGHVPIGINRRERLPDGRIVLGVNPTGALDTEVQVWRFDADDGWLTDQTPPGWVRATGEPVAVLINYACHPSSLEATVRLISADFPGVMRTVVERLLGGTALFLQGAAGDIDPCIKRPDWTIPHTFGTALGAEAARIAFVAEPVTSVPLRVLRQSVTLPRLLPATVEAARDRVNHIQARQAQLEQTGASASARWWNELQLDEARKALLAREAGETPTLDAELSVLRLGDAALAFNPAELFCEIGMAIKQASPLPCTAVVNYTDGAIWYVPTRAALRRRWIRSRGFLPGGT